MRASPWSRLPGALLALLAVPWTAAPAAEPGTEPAPGLAAAREAGAPAPLRAYRAARIITLDGPEVEGGVLLVRGTRVERVLPAGVEAPAGAEVVDLGRVVVIPGLVNPLSTITSSSSYRGGRSSSLSVRAASQDARSLRAAEGLDPSTPALRRLGSSGHAAVGLVPPGGAFLGGLAAVARPRAGPSREAVLLRDRSYLLLSYGLGQPLRELAEKELGKAADAHRKKREEKEKKKDPEKKDTEKKDPAPPAPPEAKTPEPKKDSTPAAPADAKGGEKAREAAPAAPPPPDPLVQVFAGELRAVVRVDSPAALDHFLRVVDRLPESFPFVLAAPPLEAEAVERLAARTRSPVTAVILEARLSTLRDSSVRFSSPRLFHEAGVEVALVPASDDLEGHREMLYALAELVKAGLPPEAALRAATVVPARLLGVEAQVGSLAPGREASFLVLDEEPLSARGRLLRVYLAGEEVYREDPRSGRASGEALR